MAEVIWDRPAFDDLADIIRYIDQFNPDAADQIGTRLFELGESLVDFPERGRPAEDGIRELVTVAPYVMRYTLDNDRVTILSVRHGRRGPR